MKILIGKAELIFLSISTLCRYENSSKLISRRFNTERFFSNLNVLEFYMRVELVREFHMKVALVREFLNNSIHKSSLFVPFQLAVQFVFNFFAIIKHYIDCPSHIVCLFSRIGARGF